MFEPASTPRLFGLPPGVDFAPALVDGLRARMSGQPPEEMARVDLHVNTRRMQRRIRALFAEGPACLLPRIRLVGDIAGAAGLPGLPDLPPPATALQRRLELARLIRQLIAAQPDLAPETAAFDLAQSLYALLEEMQGEGVGPDVFAGLDVSDQSGHWARTLTFLRLIAPCFGPGATDPEGRRRRAVEHLTAYWRVSPPRHPVIVAGSTGSRGTTALFMRAVAQLPQGALVLPGFDFDQPAGVWDAMQDALIHEDHPQYRFARLLRALEVDSRDVVPWVATPPACPARNRLISLALRPAPVTDQWMVEGPGLKGIPEAVRDVTLLEAPTAREEAATIALRLRKAAEDGRTAALISPSRQLTRQVAAALDRWGIEPDDSAGQPLSLSAPGRFLRHVAALSGERLTAEALLTVLKHPLTNTGSDERGEHLLWTRELELSLRRKGCAFPTRPDLTGQAAGDGRRPAWANWLADTFAGLEGIGVRALPEHLEHHLWLAETLAAGPAGGNGGALWQQAAGREARSAIDELRAAAGSGGVMSAPEYSALLHSVLQDKEVRSPERACPGIMIWGTLEARVQGADLVILGGLNEGVWPPQPAPDPWLNRTMRKQAGLLLPERRIGLSAHDFQQAVAAPEVWITRAIRDAEGQTVPSRWINRLTGLLGGLSEPDDLELSKEREDVIAWLAQFGE